MDILDCMTAEEIRSVTIDNEHLSMLSECVLYDWPSMGTKEQKEL